MKKTALLVSLLILIISGCQDDKGYSISGNVQDVPDGNKVYVSEFDAKARQPKVTDTTTIKDGKFQLDLEEKDTPVLSFLRLEGVNGNILFISENQEISFDVDKDSIHNTKVTGGKENKALSEYLNHLQELNKKMMGMQKEMRTAMMSQDTATVENLQETRTELLDNDKVFKQEIFERNKDSYLGVMVLTDMMRMKTHSAGEIKEMFDQLSETMKATPLAKSLKENLDRLGASEVGSKAPSFSAPNTEGKKIALEDNLGKVTILDFWAAWCKPCRKENPNLVATYNKFKDQGLKIISVSLDKENQKEKWLQAIEDDNMQDWTHLSNLQFWQDPIVKQYGITAIPASFILDKNGVIVAKNLRGNDLQNKVEELLN